MGRVDAGTVCASTISGKVGPNIGCQTGSIANDKLNPLQVNLDNMFAFDDWLLAEKHEWNSGWSTDKEKLDIGLKLTGDAIGGGWSINNIWANISSLMLVVKGGNGQVPDAYVGYLIAPGATSGGLATPFSKTNAKGKLSLGGVSHVSAYYRLASLATTAVPEPGTIVLLGAGLLLACGRPLATRRPA
jgi:hypothetical protein